MRGWRHLYLVGGSVESVKMQMDAELEEMVDEKWIPFCADAIDSILCFGFCVVSFEGNYPSIMKQGMYRHQILLFQVI